ncbi:MAG: carbon-nitrogen hydrolase family protein [Acidiferrobacteraceae bacterium]
MDSICRRRDRRGRAVGQSLVLAVGAGLLGGSWHLGLLGPLAAPLLILLVANAGPRTTRWATVAVYFLAGSWDLPTGAATFFGLAHDALRDYSLWVVSACLLALPWIWAARWTGTLAALVLDAVPPLGCFGWLSPLTAAGTLYPGTGLPGLAVLLALYGSIAAHKWSWVTLGLALALVVNLHFLVFGTAPAPPAGWIGVDTRIGPRSGTILAATMQRAAWLAHIQKQARHARVVVLPETIAGPWWPGTAAQIRAAVLSGQIWLVGATAFAHGRQADAVMAVRHARTNDNPLFVSPFPVPISMWHPWGRGSYQATGWEPVRTVAGLRIWAAICYDQLLPWVWVEGLLQNPQVVIAPSNDWWARGTNAPEIQQTSTWAWTRLMGAALVRAENR